MKKLIFLSVIILMAFTSCSKEEDEQQIKTPKNYDFTREGVSTVNYTKAITHYKMANELVKNLGEEGLDNSIEKLNNMYVKGEGFTGNSLDASGEKLRDVVASAKSTLSDTEKESVKTKIDAVIENFVNDVIPAKDNDASDGNAGNLNVKDEESDKKRYFNKKGIEADQTVSKILFGGLFVDQIANNYLSQQYMNTLKADNDANKMFNGKNYTELEHAWDMAYGYVFGLEDTMPLKTVKTGFLNSYLKANYKNKDDFNLFFENVLNAFKRGRQAAVDKKYDIMDEQAKIVRTQISKMMAVRTVHYLWKGRGPKNGKQLHALSEVYGFLYGLQFTHLNGKQLGTSYTKEFISEFDTNGTYGISDDKVIDKLIEKIAKDFDFNSDDAIK